MKTENATGDAPRLYQAIMAHLQSGLWNDMRNGAVADGVTQGVEARSVEAGATVALIPEDVLLCKLESCSCGPAPQGGELAIDGLLALLALGRDAGIEGGAHGGLTSGCGVERDGGSSSRRR